MQNLNFVEEIILEKFFRSVSVLFGIPFPFRNYGNESASVSFRLEIGFPHNPGPTNNISSVNAGIKKFIFDPRISTFQKSGWDTRFTLFENPKKRKR